MNIAGTWAGETREANQHSVDEPCAHVEDMRAVIASLDRFDFSRFPAAVLDARPSFDRSNSTAWSDAHEVVRCAQRTKRKVFREYCTMKLFTTIQRLWASITTGASRTMGVCAWTVALLVLLQSCRAPSVVVVGSPRISTSDGWVFNSGLWNMGDVLLQKSDGSLVPAGRRVWFAEGDVSGSEKVEKSSYSLRGGAAMSFEPGVSESDRTAFKAQFWNFISVELLDYKRRYFANPDGVVGSNRNNAELQGLRCERNERFLLVTGEILGKSEFNVSSTRSLAGRNVIRPIGCALDFVVSLDEAFYWKADGAPAFVVLAELKLSADSIKVVSDENVWAFPRVTAPSAYNR